MRTLKLLLAFIFLLTGGCAICHVPAKDTYRIALIQFDAIPEKNERNVEEIERLSRQAAAKGADIIMFHELTVADEVSDTEKYSEYIPSGPSCRKIESLAKQLKKYIAFGLSEKTKDKRYYVTYVFMGPRGFVYKYRKTWLWWAPTAANRYRHEWVQYDPGTGSEIFYLDGLKATCFICADGEAPRCIERAKLLKPDIVFYPNNREIYLGNYQPFLERAAEIGAPMLVTNRIGRSWGVDFPGGCAVISSTGKILANTDPNDGEDILIYDLAIKKEIEN